MDIENIVDLTITVTSSVLTRPSFGIPLALVSKVPAGWGPKMVRTFSKLTELTDLGFTPSDLAYKLASRIKSQSPAPKTFKLAKRTLIPAQSIHLVCLSAVTGDVYNLTVDGHDLTYTVPNSSTTTTVATAIAALIDALSSAAATSSTATITVTPQTVGTFVDIQNWRQKGSDHFDLEIVTADPGVATDAALALADDSTWYGLLLDEESKAQVAAAAAWTEANKKLFGYTTSDTSALDGASTTDAFYVQKAAGYRRSFGIYNGNDSLGYSAAAWMARAFAFDPGRITWAFKDLSGVTVDQLSAGQTSAVEAKNGNHYQAVAGVGITFPGKLSMGEFIDITHGLDWLASEIQLQTFALIKGQPKVPYTTAGVGLIEAAIRAVLRQGIRAQLLVDNDNLRVEVPAVLDVDPTTRASRVLPSVSFFANLAGAIHTVAIEGTVSA